MIGTSRHSKPVSQNGASVMLAALCTAVISSCAETPSAPESGSPTIEVYAATPVSIDAVAGSQVDGPAVKVVNARSGKPVAGMVVEFRAQIGSVERQSVTTDESGIASAGKLYTGERTGSYQVHALIGESRSLFVVRVAAAAPASLIAFDSRVAGLAGKQIAPPVVRVIDRFGNSVGGVSTDFRVVAGGGNVEPSSRVTNHLGIASPDKWRLGDLSGENALVVTVSGLDAVIFRTQGIDSASLQWFALDSVAYSESFVIAAGSRGASMSRLGLTPFDPCMCVAQRGYFVVEVEEPRFNPASYGTGGLYSVEPPRLHVHGPFGVGQIETTPSYPLLVVHDQFQPLTGGRVEFEMHHWDPEWWEWNQTTWIFKK